MTPITSKDGKAPSFTFNYDGFSRIVDGVSIETDHDTIIGYEVRKGGKFSYRVKRYKLDRISELVAIAPVTRQGPVIARKGK